MPRKRPESHGHANSPLDEVLKLSSAKQSLEKLVGAGCDRDILARWLQLLARPVKHRADWYHLNGFPPDKLRRYPQQLDSCAREIEALNNAIAGDEMYRGLVGFMAKHPVLASFGPDWFQIAFKSLPERLRQYGAVISFLKFAAQEFAPKAAERGRQRIVPQAQELVFYVYLATRAPHYEDVATILNAGCSARFGTIDATALRRRFNRSEYAKKIRQLKATASQL